MSFFVTGIVGTCVFSLLLFGAIFNFNRAQAMGKTLISSFFASMVVYSTLEIPRYVYMIAERDYISKVGYCLHVVAVGCYFVALSIICFSWMFLLFLEKEQESIAMKKRCIYVANGFLFIFVLLSIYFCATAHSLESYFDSQFYFIYMVAEVVIFLFYNSAVVFFGLKISYRFRNFIRTGGEKTDAFKRALVKVTTLMVVNTICAAVRVTMLILKIMHIANSFDTRGDSFVHYGIIWFTLTDFIPFCIGGATFQFIMVTGGQRKSSGHEDATRSLLRDTSKTEDHLRSSAFLSDENNRGQPTAYFKTPNQHHHQNIVDSDADNTPDDVSPYLLDEESARRRAQSYDANSSVTTNSPYYGQHSTHFSPNTPHQRWMSFNSSSMLPSSLSPAVPSNHRKYAKSMSNLQNISGYTPPPRCTLTPLGDSKVDVSSPHHVERGSSTRVVSQKHQALGSTAPANENNVISTLSTQDFMSEGNSPSNNK